MKHMATFCRFIAHNAIINDQKQLQSRKNVGITLLTQQSQLHYMLDTRLLFAVYFLKI